MVDVLNYYCSVQREEHRKAPCAAPAGRNNTVLLPEYDWYANVNMHIDISQFMNFGELIFTFLCLHSSSEPILRLGETYSMGRTRRPPGKI